MSFYGCENTMRDLLNCDAELFCRGDVYFEDGKDMLFRNVRV
jgi:hypothetical protein